jgi:hypothetical protein
MDMIHASTFMSQEKSMKKMVASIPSFDQENMHLPLPYYSGSAMNFDDNFWNIMFDKKLSKHKDKLDAIFARSLL